GGENVDASIQQGFHILPTFLARRARRVRMRALINQANLWLPAQDADHIHLLGGAAAGHNLHQWNALQPLGSLDEVLASVWLQESNHNIHAARLEFPRVLDHLIGLAYARRISEIDLEAASRFKMRHDFAPPLVREYPNVHLPRSPHQPANGASEQARPPVSSGALADEDLRDCV